MDELESLRAKQGIEIDRDLYLNRRKVLASDKIWYTTLAGECFTR